MKDLYTHIVSIHAPARGATHVHYYGFCGDAFQSTPLREGRRREEQYYHKRKEFQSTPLREGRRLVYMSQKGMYGRFNPRPCARGDTYDLSQPVGIAGFNPRPCARGDRLSPYKCPAGKSFNPRPCARGDADFMAPIIQG